jgi:hypothetical protein
MKLSVIVGSAIAIVAIVIGTHYWVTHPQLARGLVPLVSVAGVAAMAYGARKKS